MIILLHILFQGIVDFANQKISSALDCFTKSLTINPSCDASIRTAIAICCYKAGQYDRAKLALKRSCDIEVKQE